MRVDIIDFLKFVAIVLMVFFNYSYTLLFLRGWIILNKNFFYWFIFPRIIASIFIVASGMSAYESFLRRKKLFAKRYFGRGIKLLLIAILITFATYSTFPEYTIHFGIIHFFALTSFIIPFLIKFKKLLIFLAVLSFLLSIPLSNLKINNLTLLPIGIVPENYKTFDYFPIFPWLSLILIGIFIQKTFRRKIIKIKIENLKFLLSIGKHSLLIYILHQPILFLLLSLF